MPESGSSNSRRLGFAVIALLVVSFALRLWFASPKLDASRFYDERFSFRNVSAALIQGHVKPNNAYYPTLSYLPHTAVLAASEGLHRLTGWQRLTIFDERKPFGFSSTAYLIARAVSMIFAIATLWWVFILGRRMFSPEAGLLAAALLAGIWGHMQASAMFKPDILVVLLVLVTFKWSLDAAERPSLQRFLIAGVGVGLTASAKYNGVGVAVVVAAAALAGHWRDPRRWQWLAVAGVASALTFVALNPYLPLVSEYLGRQQILYQGNANAAGGTHWSMPIEEVKYLIRHHGLPMFALAVAGCVGLATRAARARESNQRLGALLLLTFVMGYSIFYAAITPLFRGQNYLPVTAFTSLAAAWVMVEAWRRAADRWRPMQRPAVAWMAALAIVAAASSGSVGAAYHDVVPSTADLAGRFLQSRLQPVDLHQIVFERTGGDPVRPFRKGDYMPTVGVDRLWDLDEAQLELADAEVFPASRLEEPDGGRYLRRLADGETQRIEPTWLGAHGPELVVRLRSWHPDGDPQALSFEQQEDGAFTATLPILEPGEVFSVTLTVPAERGQAVPFEARLDSESPKLFEISTESRRARFVLPRRRFVPGVETLSIRFEMTPGEMPLPEAELHRWRAP